MIQKYRLSENQLTTLRSNEVEVKNFVAIANHSGNAASGHGRRLHKSSVQARAEIQMPKMDTTFALADDILTFT